MVQNVARQSSGEMAVLCSFVIDGFKTPPREREFFSLFGEGAVRLERGRRGGDGGEQGCFCCLVIVTSSSKWWSGDLDMLKWIQR